KMSESLEGVVTIDDMSLPVVQRMLRFIYTGKCFDDKEKEKESDTKTPSFAAVSASSTETERKDSKSTSAQSAFSLSIEAQLLAAADRFQPPDVIEVCSSRL